MVASDTQPQALPLLRARITGASVRAISRRAGVVDGPRTGRGPGTPTPSTHVRTMQTTAITASTQNRPCQPVTSTRTPPRSGPAAAPTAAAAPHNDTARSCACPLLATDSRLRPQARIVAPAAPWMNRPAMTSAAGRGQPDEHARHDEEQQTELEDPLPAEDVTERARRDDDGGAHQRVAGDRPLQGLDVRAGVGADRGEEDAHRGRVGVDDEGRQAGGGEDATSRGGSGARHLASRVRSGGSSG